jgi:hypothetical protein
LLAVQAHERVQEEEYMSVASIAIAAAALAVSLSAFLASVLTSRRRDKRDLFLRVHERLASTDQQRGRQLIHRMNEQHRKVADLTDEEYEAINNALSILNVECFYYARRYISRQDMLENWAHSIARVYEAAEPFVAYRDAQTAGARNWPALHKFAADARAYLGGDLVGQLIGDATPSEEDRSAPAP